MVLRKHKNFKLESSRIYLLVRPLNMKYVGCKHSVIIVQLLSISKSLA